VNWDIVLANYYAGLEVLAAVVAVIICISSLDDFFIDLWYWTYRLGRIQKLRHERNHRPLEPGHLQGRAEQPIAIMVPAWKEYDVIAAMVENMVEVLDYRNYVVFIGTYMNDPATIEEAERMCRRYRQVRRVEVPHPGPTCKADCLNFVVEAIFSHERESGVEFAGVVLHDSEDVLHPLELKFFNHLLPRKSMIQLPVISLEREWYELVAGTYMDEFAESHKEMVVRENLTGMVPSAGVGTCFSRRALAALVGATRNHPFNTASLTEDYEIGMRLSQLGMQSIFGEFTVDYRAHDASETGAVTGTERAVRMPLSVREFFPDDFKTAYRQKSRWVLGIGLQGWEQIQWRGRSLAIRYLLIHDRKGTVTAFVGILAYLLVIQFILFHAGLVTGWWNAYYPSLFQADSAWRGLIDVNTAFLANRVMHRMHFTSRLYGWKQGLLAVPRMVVGNFVNFMAVARAWRLFFSYLFFGKRLAWDKTMHDYPTSTQLGRKRQRLGELLQSWQAVNEKALSQALEQQAAAYAPLGRLLVANQCLDEETLTEAIAYQADLPRGDVAFEAVRAHASVLPLELALRCRAVPVGRNPGGKPLVAVACPLDADALAEIGQALGDPPLQRIVRDDDIAHGLRWLREAAGRETSSGAPEPHMAIIKEAATQTS
jgi:bacteriophage N4 adsorption protein B